MLGLLDGSGPDDDVRSALDEAPAAPMAPTPPIDRPRPDVAAVAAQVEAAFDAAAAADATPAHPTGPTEPSPSTSGPPPGDDPEDEPTPAAPAAPAAVDDDRVTPLRSSRRLTPPLVAVRRFSSEGSTAIDADADADAAPADGGDPGPDADPAVHVQSAADLISRLRSVTARTLPTGHHRDPLLVERPDALVERGPIDDSPVTRVLEAARIHGLEVLHGIELDGVDRIDHLIVAVNGIWVVQEERTLTGLLDKRDLGDWFTADARLYIGEHDRTDLVVETRDRAEALRRFLAPTPHFEVPSRPVVCFGDVAPGWVTEPFVLGGVSVTWRTHLVEPMLDPVLLDRDTRSELVHLFADAAA